MDEDEEIYTDKDPLTDYLKKINMCEKDKIVKTTPKKDVCKKFRQKMADFKSMVLPSSKPFSYESDFPYYQEKIMQSGLLFADDCEFLQNYVGGDNNKFINKVVLYGTPLISLPIMYYFEQYEVKLLSGVLFIPPVMKYLKRRSTTNNIESAVYTFRCVLAVNRNVRYLTEEYFKLFRSYNCHSYDSTLYDMLQKLMTFHYKILTVQTLYLKNYLKFLDTHVPLKVEVDYLLTNRSKPIEVTPKDIHYKFDCYLLLQATFLKKLALCFCPNLWTSSKNKEGLNKVLQLLNNVNDDLMPDLKTLQQRVTMYKRFGTAHGNRFPKFNVYNKDIKSLQYSLRNLQRHFHTLLIKANDAENILVTHDLYNDHESADKVRFILNDIRMQMAVTKDHTENCSKKLNSTITPIIDLSDLFRQDTPKTEETTKTAGTKVSAETPVAVIGSQTYELYIPKEGFPEECDLKYELPTKNYDYSSSLLSELKLILHERNPDIAEEKKDVPEEEPQGKTLRDINVPQGPIGFAGADLNQVLLTRSNTMQSEEFFGSESEDEDEEKS